MFKYIFGYKESSNEKGNEEVTSIQNSIPEPIKNVPTMQLQQQNKIESQPIKESQYISLAEYTTLLTQNNSNSKSKLIYVVLNKNTHIPLGVYDTLDKAKLFGQKATYYNCIILEFKLNDQCKYIINPVFENK